jgi:hypothetical protein
VRGKIIMKKIIIGILSFAIVGGVTWFGVYKQVSAEKVESKKSPVVVYTNIEEPDLENGSLSDAIHNSHIFLKNLILDNNQLDTFDFEKNKENLETVILYQKGAINWAEKVYASKEIKRTLKDSLVQTEKAIINKDSNSLYNVVQTLEKLDAS